VLVLTRVEQGTWFSISVPWALSAVPFACDRRVRGAIEEQECQGNKKNNKRKRLVKTGIVLGTRTKVCLPFMRKIDADKVHFVLRLPRTQLSLHTSIAVYSPQRLPIPMSTPQISQIRCPTCDRVFSPRRLSQHLSKTACHVTPTVLNMLSVFQTASGSGSSLGPNPNSASWDPCVRDPGDEPSGE
jgi:hypothetical protein